MKGKRVYPDEEGLLNLKSGEYGCYENGTWYAIPFNSKLIANLNGHNIVEHEDGTITVSPSILVRNHTLSWHGYLERGVWREC